MNYILTETFTPTYHASEVSLEILVNGKRKPIKQYKHKNKTYIEGRAKSTYSILVRNHNAHEVLAVISVDGMSVIDGTPASENSRGWIISGNSHVEIPGWLVDSKNAAKFQFDDKKESYAEQSEDGDVKNTGVIGCMVFEKKHYERPKTKYVPYPVYPVYPPVYPEPYKPFQPMWLGGSQGNADIGPKAGDLNSAFRSVQQSFSATNSAHTPGVTLSSSPSTASVNNVSSPVVAEETSLGTAFGDKTDFQTRQSSFERGPLLKTFVLYYDNKRNLEKLGISFDKKKKVVNEAPNPFPASTKFCNPPKGW